MKTIAITAAALAALAAPAESFAQAAPTAAVDIESLTPLAGRWSYRSYAGGSEAAFGDLAGRRLAIRCNRAVRTVSIIRSSVPAATASLSVWTTSLSRSVPARYDTSRVLTADVAITDPLLDAIALSRGRFATSALGAPMAAYPSWAEPGRVIEDCRS